VREKNASSCAAWRDQAAEAMRRVDLCETAAFYCFAHDLTKKSSEEMLGARRGKAREVDVLTYGDERDGTRNAGPGDFNRL